MADLNWIDKNERLPTKEDSCDEHVYVLTQNAIVACVHLNHFKNCIGSFTHWLPFREMPVPKRWRVPTIHDLAKAGKPIPCRVKFEGKFVSGRLDAIDIHPDSSHKFYCSGTWCMYCEICDE